MFMDLWLVTNTNVDDALADWNHALSPTPETGGSLGEAYSSQGKHPHASRNILSYF